MSFIYKANCCESLRLKEPYTTKSSKSILTLNSVCAWRNQNVVGTYESEACDRRIVVQLLLGAKDFSPKLLDRLWDPPPPHDCYAEGAEDFFSGDKAAET